VLPNVDIEGEKLSRHVPDPATDPDAAVRRLPVGRQQH
jgi:RND superfamily putative drug exporter